MPVAATPRATDGVDPRFVFKIKSEAGFPNDDILTLRELEVLGTDAQSTYFVLAEDGGRAFAAALESYGQGDDVDGGSGHLKSLYNKIDSIELYGVSDRSGPGIDSLPATGQVVIDVTMWPSSDMDESRHRVSLLELRVGELHGEVIARSVLPRFTVARVQIDATAVANLLELYVIESARLPPVPYIDPSDWNDVSADNLTVEHASSSPIGVLDDLPAQTHPLLADNVTVHPTPITLSRAWEPPGPHGTMVTGIALAADLAADLRAGATIRTAGHVHAVRVLEPISGTLDSPSSRPKHSQCSW